MDYEKKYNDALKRAKELLLGNEQSNTIRSYFEHIFPELRESERIRKELLDFVRSFWADHKEKLPQASRWVTYLEKQKPSSCIYWHKIKKGERLPCRAYVWNPDYEKHHDCFEGRLIANLENISVGGDTWYLPADDVRNLPREGVDELPRERKPISQEDFDTAKHEALWGEQKPNSTEDMPYVADEHFFEREPADSFKYRLAEYMTKNCKKGEGPYGYSYNISSESILQIAKEELIKRGELKEQKPAWSEDEERLINTSISFLKGFADKGYENAVECIDWLKSKLNGNSCK